MSSRYIIFIILFIIFNITACSNLPTVKYCNEITYVREGNKINITASCNLPLEQGPEISPSDLMLLILPGLMI